jgi:signal recognition particle GTPase
MRASSHVGIWDGLISLLKEHRFSSRCGCRRFLRLARNAGFLRDMRWHVYAKEFLMPKRRDYDRSDITKMQAVLKSLPKKEREKKRFAVPDIVKEMRMEIRAALGRGYTLDEVITALNSQGAFDLKTPTIKRYISGAKRKKTVSSISGKFSEKKSEEVQPILKDSARKKSSAVSLPSSDDL